MARISPDRSRVCHLADIVQVHIQAGHIQVVDLVPARADPIPARPTQADLIPVLHRDFHIRIPVQAVIGLHHMYPETEWEE